MVILGALKWQLLINFFKTKVLITQNESFHRKKSGAGEGSLENYFPPTCHLKAVHVYPKKLSSLTCFCCHLSEVQVLSFFIILSSQLFYYFYHLLLNCFGGKKVNRKPQKKSTFFHAFCILLNSNTVRHSCADLRCRLSSYLWQRALDMFRLTPANYSSVSFFYC